MDFAILKDARIGPTDVARQLKVNRVTISLWLNGHTEPSSLVRERLQEFLDTVGRAYDAGDLPVPFDVSRRERGLYLTNLLSRYRTVEV